MNRRRSAATLLCTLLAGASAASAAHAAGTTDKIVFSRNAFVEGGMLDHVNLYRINADGTGFRQLTSTIQYRYRWTPSWSPHGTWITYSGFKSPVGFHYDVYVANNAGDRHRQITTGDGDFQFPSWSPKGSWIAFKSTDFNGKTCVAVVRPDGTAQHPVFCPPTAVVQPLAPLWSTDGNAVYIAADYLDTNGFHRMIVYRVNVATGNAVVLSDLGTAASDTLVYFAPGGARGLLGSPQADNGLEVVNFASGNRHGVGSGHSPVWSPDTHHIAFSREVFEQDGQSADDAFVVNDDGTNGHALTTTTTPDVFNAPGDWSPDSTRVLVNRTTHDANGIPVIQMSIIDATTLASTPLTGGVSGPGAWFKPVQ